MEKKIPASCSILLSHEHIFPYFFSPTVEKKIPASCVEPVCECDHILWCILANTRSVSCYSKLVSECDVCLIFDLTLLIYILGGEY